MDLSCSARPTLKPSAKPTERPTTTTDTPTQRPTTPAPTPSLYNALIDFDYRNIDEKSEIWENVGIAGDNVKMENINGLFNSDYCQSLYFHSDETKRTFNFDMRPSVKPVITLEIWVKLLSIPNERLYGFLCVCERACLSVSLCNFF